MQYARGRRCACVVRSRCRPWGSRSSTCCESDLTRLAPLAPTCWATAKSVCFRSTAVPVSVSTSSMRNRHFFTRLLLYVPNSVSALFGHLPSCPVSCCTPLRSCLPQVLRRRPRIPVAFPGATYVPVVRTSTTSGMGRSCQPMCLLS